MITIRKLLDLLTPAERKQVYLLLVLILAMAMLETVGAASIMPFVALLANPLLIETNPFLNVAYNELGFTDSQSFLFALGLLTFSLLVASLALKALTTYAQLRFILMREYSFGKRLVEGYLHQPYSWFLSRHSADLGKSIFSEVNQVVGNCVSPMMTLIAHGTVSIALLTLLIVIDLKLALLVGCTLVTAYWLIFRATRGLLGRIGKERVIANRERFTAVSDAFGAAKEVKFSGLEQAFIQRFSTSARIYARHQATAQIISQLPRFALEAIAFGGIVLVVLYLVTQSGSFNQTLPIISFYTFAGYRLIPALQQVYGAVTQLRYAGSALDALHAELKELKPINSNSSKDIIVPKYEITLNQIQYCYPNAQWPTLKGLSFTIPAKSIVGLVGSTGSGKTTTADLILGLLDAQTGTLEIDGQVISPDCRRAWQRSIGYVPQQIYLVDDTVSANIAFGCNVEDIDHVAVEHAAKIANLHDFVMSELPQQYQTTVGERGVRLSGGQRQRIGIARALYHKPQVLILDEATSALDNLTEQAVMEAIQNLGNEITIILIAHRLSTVKTCDVIFLLEKGELAAEGTFNQLLRTNKRFRAMATGSSDGFLSC